MIFDQLTDTQRKVLMFGVPLAAGVFVVSRVAGRSGASADASDGGDAPAADLPVGAVGPYAMPSTDAIGTGALSDFLSGLTDQYDQLQQNITVLMNRPHGVSPPPPRPRRTDAQIIAACDLVAMFNRRISLNDPRISRGCRRAYVAYALRHGATPA